MSTPVTVRVLPPDRASGTMPLAVAAVVLAVLFWPVGIPLSIATIVRSARAGRVSRLGILALLVGGLALGATVTLLVVIIGGFLTLVPR